MKNASGYLRHDELSKKLMIAKFMGLTPVFVARMLPKTVLSASRCAAIVRGESFHHLIAKV